MAKNKIVKRPRGRPKLRHGGYSFMRSGKIPADKPEIERYLTWLRLKYIDDLGPEEADLTAGQAVLLNKLITLEGLTRCIEVMASREEKVMLPQRYMSYVNTIVKICQVRVSPLSGQKTGSFKVHSVPALNDFIFSI